MDQKLSFVVISSLTPPWLNSLPGKRTVTGLFMKPALSGRIPALIINHGTGGRTQPNGFTDRRTQEMPPWGLFCIGPDLTHCQGAAVNLETFGYSPENLARDLPVWRCPLPSAMWTEPPRNVGS